MNEPRKRTNPFAALGQALIAAAEAPPPAVLPRMDDPGHDESMTVGDPEFDRIAAGETGLWLLALITVPDGRLFRGWRREDCPSQPHELAANLADLVLTNHRTLRSVGAPEDDLWSVIEAPGALLLVRQFRLDFALGGLFVLPANQGSARLSMRRLIRFIEPALPAPSVELSL